MRKAAMPGRPAAGPLWRLVSAVAAVALAVLVALPIASRLDPIVGDLVVLGLSPPEATTPAEAIVIVTITEDTLAAFPYRSPIDRGLLADLLLSLDAARPASIGLDILLDSPSEPDKDRRLSQVLDRVATPVVLATVTDDFLTDAQAAHLRRVLDGRLSGSVRLRRDDADGVLRHRPQGEEGQPLFTEAMAGRRFPETPFDSRILYRGAPADAQGAFPKYPAHTVAVLPAAWFQGRHVLIGVDLPGIDRHPTPLTSARGVAAGSMAGIEVHAHLLAQLLSGRDLPVPTFPQTLALLVSVAALAAGGFSLVKRPKLFFAAFAVLLVGYPALAWSLAHDGTVLLPVLGPIAAAVAGVLLLALVRWRQDRRERAFVVSAFEKYVSPEVVRRLASGEVDLALGGRKRLVTYIFTDLQGFTTLSESLPADQVADILNGYMDQVCDVVFRHGATFDKLIGDAVVCFLGAPEEDPDQAPTAVSLALALDRTAEDYRAALAPRGISLGVTRIGVHCGDAVIGNFGGHRFFDYTGVGDTVNTAARLEGANKYLRSRICVSETVVARCETLPGVVFRPLGDVVLKGRTQALACFEPLASDRDQDGWIGAYRRAFDLLRDGDPAAEAAFEGVLAIAPDDGPTRFHLERLRAGEVGAKIELSGK
jgi:adenylate cyclase